MFRDGKVQGQVVETIRSEQEEGGVGVRHEDVAEDGMVGVGEVNAIEIKD